jgi:predicted deacylase
VKNGPATSISLSVTWRSEWSYAEADARGMNAVLRRAGIAPSPTGRYPSQNRAKAFAYRIVRRLTT